MCRGQRAQAIEVLKTCLAYVLQKKKLPNWMSPSSVWTLWSTHCIAGWLSTKELQVFSKQWSRMENGKCFQVILIL